MPQDDLYSRAWEAKSDFSHLEGPIVYREPVATERTNSRNAFTQQNNDEHSSEKHCDASDLVNDESHSQKHSSRVHVNPPKIDLPDDIEALNENDSTS